MDATGLIVVGLEFVAVACVLYWAWVILPRCQRRVQRERLAQMTREHDEIRQRMQERHAQLREQLAYKRLHPGTELAQERARELLREHLTPEQWQEWDTQLRFRFQFDGSSWVITRTYAGNIRNEDTGRAYCIVPKAPHGIDNYTDCVPVEDHALGTMLLLRANPTLFHSIAL